MLAYSVFSLRLSEDVPSQSDSVHLISLYLTVCMFFSLSAMTWFAIVNKFREKKRLPYFLRWLALDYIAWIVFAASMHRKTVRLTKDHRSKTSPITPSTPISVPLQSMATSNSITTPTEYSNHYYFERDSLVSGSAARTALMSQKSLRISGVNLSSCDPQLPADDSDTPHRTCSAALWIRRQRVKSPTFSSNGPSNKKQRKASTQSHITRILQEESPTMMKESLYAIHIYNRLVFLMFLLVVIFINIYTWFFYSRSVKSKLLDDQTAWICYDESLLSIVNCSYFL